MITLIPKCFSLCLLLLLKENILVKVPGIIKPVNHLELEKTVMPMQKTDNFMKIK